MMNDVIYSEFNREFPAYMYVCYITRLNLIRYNIAELNETKRVYIIGLGDANIILHTRKHVRVCVCVCKIRFSGMYINLMRLNTIVNFSKIFNKHFPKVFNIIYLRLS